jgi:two-component system, cell cycle sensor histidine kinase DivJ
VSSFHAIGQHMRQLLRMGRRPGESAEARPYGALAATAGDLVLHLDSSGGALWSASGDRDAFGWAPDVLLGRGFFQRVHLADCSALLLAIDEALRGEATVCLTLRLKTGLNSDNVDDEDGRDFRHAQLRIRRFPDVAGQTSDHVVCIVTRFVEKLGDKREAAGAAGGADDPWNGRLLADVSHELRTPLNAIIGFSEILGSADFAPQDFTKYREYAGIIHTSAEHLLSVVNLILDTSKIEARRFAIAPEQFSVAPLIASCCNMLSLKAHESGVELIQTPIDIPRELIADKRACRQIMINLLSNAVKFTPRHGRVTVGARVEGDWLIIHVNDTGIGIAPSHFPSLGKPYYQVRAPGDPVVEGTGLGLSLVRALVGLHGGAVLLESVVGEGTRVVVRLPLDCRGKALADGSPAPIELSSNLSRISLTPFAHGSPSRHATKERKIA